MAKILIFDTECNSLDVNEGFIQELAWAIYDVASWRCLKAHSALVRWNRQYEVEPGAFAVTGLSREFCELQGTDANNLFLDFVSDIGMCHYLCGHNVLTYDIPMATTNIKRACFGNLDLSLTTVIDTLIDCPFPSTMKVHALKYLALDHGYILSDAHQALADVFACKAILSKYDFNQVLEISKTPIVTLTTKIDFNNLEARERVKNARFYWNPTRKLWEKKIREYHLPGIQLKLEGIAIGQDAGPLFP